jgi:hypothetical protein
MGDALWLASGFVLRQGPKRESLRRRETGWSEMISHPHRTIFIHIPKCGGQSIENAFLNDLGLSWEDRAPLLLARNRNQRIGPPRLAHLTGADYIRYFYATPAQFEEYYTFSVVRNPVDRVISAYSHLKIRTRFGTRIEFDAFVEDWLPAQLETKSADGRDYLTKQGWFMRPQTEYLLDGDGKLMVKDVFFLNTLNENYEVIRQKSNLKSELPHVNKSKKFVTTKDVRSELISVIHDIYKVDFEFLEENGFSTD